MYSPQMHQEIARQRQSDLLRQAQKERLASLAVGERNRSHLVSRTLARFAGLSARLSPQPHHSRPAVDATA